MNLPAITHRSALISPDGKYRYWLERRWGRGHIDSPIILWGMLNPSKADALVDDPTVKRCVGFSHGWGFERFVIVNLYAYRATNPRDLEGLSREELEGPDNLDWLYYYATMPHVRLMVCAWGSKRFKCVPLPTEILAARNRWALGFNIDGEPKHPLYLPADTWLVPIKTYT